MTDVWTLAALWLALALIATLFAIWFRVSTALTEIIVGTIAQFVLVGLVGTDVLGTNEPWVKFLAGLGAIVLTFLAGAELDPVVFRRNWKEATAVGLIGFFAPFFGCAAAAYWILDWGPQQSWLAGVALSTTSVAVVYAVMLEYGFNKTDYGKIVLAACFINDLGTVLALGFIFAPFTVKTLIFAAIAVVFFVALPWLTPWIFQALWQSPVRARGEISASPSVRSRRAGGVGGQRGRVAGLYHRDGACRHGGKGSRPDPAPAHAHARASHAVLFHSCGLVRLHSGIGGGANRFHCAARGQDGDEIRRHLPGHQSVRVSAKGSHVYDAAHVHGADIRHHLGPVRPFARHHRSSRSTRSWWRASWPAPWFRR